jgi:hypothetical protein
MGVLGPQPGGAAPHQFALGDRIVSGRDVGAGRFEHRTGLLVSVALVALRAGQDRRQFRIDATGRAEFLAVPGGGVPVGRGQSVGSHRC